MDFEPNDIRTIIDGCLERWFKRVLGLVLGSAVIGVIGYDVLGLSVRGSVIAGICLMWAGAGIREEWKGLKQHQSIREALDGPLTWRERATWKFVRRVISLTIVWGLLILFILWVSG